LPVARTKDDAWHPLTGGDRFFSIRARLRSGHKLFRCRTIMNCTDICPKGLNPALAISKMRHKIVARRS
jgi:succinate dehydrogenase/fumarate reductase-like Fe-S protein